MKMKSKFFKKKLKKFFLGKDKNPINFQLNTPLKWGKSINFFIISIFTFGFIFAFFSKIEEVIIAKGDLESVFKIKKIRPLTTGLVEEVLIKEGQLVKEGDLLMVLDSDLEINKVNYLSKILGKTVEKNNQQIKILDEKILSLKKSLNMQEVIVEKYKFLYEQGAFSEIGYLKEKEILNNISSNILQIQLEQKKLNKEIEIQIEDLENNLKQTNKILSQKYIKSPSDGRVFNLQIPQGGVVVRSDDPNPLLLIVPENSLNAKVFISNKDIAFAKVGQNAEVRIDAYPFTEFGSVSGKLESIGQEVINKDSTNKQSFFPATISLENQVIKKGGKSFALLSGQTVQANLIVRKKRIITLLTDVFAKILDPLKSIKSNSSLI